MDRFWDLLERSVIVQGVITLCLVITVCVMVGLSKAIPADLWTALALVLGFWFGSKVQNEVHAADRRRTNNEKEL